MSAISLTLTSPLEPSVRDTLGDMNAIAAALGIDYVLIGATARDIVLHHHFGAPRPRATRDIDFAIYVGDWDDFQRARDALVGRGYTAEREPHRLHSPTETPSIFCPSAAWRRVNPRSPGRRTALW